MKILPMATDALVGAAIGLMIVGGPIAVDHLAPVKSVRALVEHDGACYRVNGMIPAAYNSAEEFIEAQPERAAKALRPIATPCSQGLIQ